MRVTLHIKLCLVILSYTSSSWCWQYWQKRVDCSNC